MDAFGAKRIKMSLEKNYLLAFYIVIGLIILGLAAYMYDSINKEIPEEDSNNDIFAGNRKMLSIIKAPFKYIITNLQYRNYYALIPFSLFIVLLITVILIGLYMNNVIF